MNQNWCKKLISGQTKGFFSCAVFCFLIAASKIYSFIIRLRNFFYDRHIFAIHKTKAIVISIGNITTGGTGKTPLVAWLCSEITKAQRQKNDNCKVAILTRGYKTNQTKDKRLKTQDYRLFLRDEPAVLAESCPQADIVINPNRVTGAAEAIGKFAANVLVLDDGFQHLALRRPSSHAPLRFRTGESERRKRQPRFPRPLAIRSR